MDCTLWGRRVFIISCSIAHERRLQSILLISWYYVVCFVCDRIYCAYGASRAHEERCEGISVDRKGNCGCDCDAIVFIGLSSRFDVAPCYHDDDGKNGGEGMSK